MQRFDNICMLRVRMPEDPAFVLSRHLKIDCELDHQTTNAKNKNKTLSDWHNHVSRLQRLELNWPRGTKNKGRGDNREDQ
jgi:hypothetical protein